jgi:hypothetical protein
MTHDELAHDLAVCRAGCGEIARERISIGAFSDGGQMDVGSIRASKSNPRPRCWEVKVSRADFLADIRAGKWKKYLPFVGELYFATPRDLIDPREVPAGAGLAFRGANGWYVRKAAPLEKVQRVELFLTGLLLSDHPAVWKEATRDERVTNGLDACKARSDFVYRQQLGRRVAEILQQNSELRRTVEELKGRIYSLEAAVPYQCSM